MHTATNIIAGTIEDMQKGFKFFFILPDDSTATAGIPIYVPLKSLKESGITGKIGAGTAIEVVARELPDGRWRSDEIVSIDGRMAVVPEQPKVKARGEAKAPAPAAIPQLVHDLFVNCHEVDRNAATNEALYVVKTMKGELVRYVVGNLEGELIRSLEAGLSIAEARLAIGRTVKVPQPASGGKTNDPAVSRGMKGSSSGGGGDKQKKRAA